MKTELISLINFKPIHYKNVVLAYVIVYPLDRNGNTYHRVTLIDQQGNEIADSGKLYGYGNQYEVTTQRLILSCIDIPAQYKKLGGNIKESGYSMSTVFNAMKENKFLKIQYSIKK